jgi:hypothetical protein
MIVAAVDRVGQGSQHGAGDVEFMPGDGCEHSLYGRFDGSGRLAIQRLSPPCQSQQPSTPITFVGPPADQAPTFESLQDGCKRTGVQMQNVSQLRRVDAWKPANDPNHKALRARDAKRRRHGLGSALKCVVDAPNQTQEVDGVTDWQGACHEIGPTRRVSHGGLHEVRRVFQGACRFPLDCGCSTAPPMFACVQLGRTATDPVDRVGRHPHRFRHLLRR